MHRRYALRGGVKWSILLAVILMLEVAPGPTLSSAHAQALMHRKYTIPVLLLHLYLVLHLWRILPDEIDPLRNLDKIKVARNVIA